MAKYAGRHRAPAPSQLPAPRIPTPSSSGAFSTSSTPSTPHPLPAPSFGQSSAVHRLAPLVRRPALSAGAAVIIIGAAATGYVTAGGATAAEQGPAMSAAALVTSPEAVDRSDQADLRQASADTAATASASVAAAAARDAEAAAAAQAAAEAEAARAAEADRAARDAQRQAVIANAKADPKSVAQAMLADYGWSDSQFSCLSSLWTKESGWNYAAKNSSSGAYGIPQSLPGSKMGTVAGDWQTNPVTQITWGLKYIQSTYGSPCSAWAHSQATNWY